MVKGANRVVSSVLSEFLKGTSTLPLPSFHSYLFIRSKRNQKGIRFFFQFEKKKLNDKINAKLIHLQSVSYIYILRYITCENMLEI